MEVCARTRNLRVVASDIRLVGLAISEWRVITTTRFTREYSLFASGRPLTRDWYCQFTISKFTIITEPGANKNFSTILVKHV